MSKIKSKDFHRRQHKLKKLHKKMKAEHKNVNAIIEGYARAKAIQEQLETPTSFDPPEAANERTDDTTAS